MVDTDAVADLLFEARTLKKTPRSGYRFLGAGNETVAEHSFLVAFISFVMTQMDKEADPLRLISMGLLHDLAEARTGDLDAVQKQYATADEEKAVEDIERGGSAGEAIGSLLREFITGETRESQLARDADQLAFVLDLKALKDTGYQPASQWLDSVEKRLQTDIGRKIAAGLRRTLWDTWWRKNLLDRYGKKD